MVPRPRCPERSGSSAPRARGDGPNHPPPSPQKPPCSPRTRGWSLPGAGAACGGAGAPRARGDGPTAAAQLRAVLGCSPRTRGWSHRVPAALRPVAVLPAHAGMVPGRTCLAWTWCGAPRARGDGPSAARSTMGEDWYSPRTRGWSLTAWARDAENRVLPAHAGMVPGVPKPPDHGRSAPRARGDGPPATWASPAFTWCSPRTRGWSQPDMVLVHGACVLPANAGDRSRRVPLPISLGWGVRHEGLGRGPSTGPFARRHINVTGTYSFRDERR